jgi:hypothetical protein
MIIWFFILFLSSLFDYIVYIIKGGFNTDVNY